ncbi:MAG: Uncharacterized protein JWM09_1274 [Francisellaceae bacterium]|nr:Uncharacterized protein [Francisellaceae bacterium]
MVARIGFFGDSTVEIEDFVRIKEGRKFFHKTYPITVEEAKNFLAQVNHDRTIYHDANQESLNKSGPGGPKYNIYKFNCKSYALTLMRKIGIIDKSLSNWGIDHPQFSGPLEELKLDWHDTVLRQRVKDKYNKTTFKSEVINKNQVLRWNSPLILSPRLSLSKFSNVPAIEVAQINFAVKFLEYQNFIDDLITTLNDMNTIKIRGYSEFLHDLSKIRLELKSFSKEEVNKYTQDIQEKFKNIEKNYIRL